MQTFIVRVWDDSLEGGSPSLRGIVQHVPSQAEQAFHSAQELLALLADLPDRITLEG